MSQVKNILFCLADDASHFGPYGHDFVSTPNIDALAKEGLTFDAAFTTNPKCAPSRCSILTGMHTWRLKDGCNHFGYFPDGVEVFTDIAEESGYAVGFTGKGWAPGDWQRCGRTRNPAGNEYNEIKLTPPPSSKISDIDYASNFASFLDQKGSRPFLFWFGSKEPHRPYDPNEAKNITVENEAIPPYWPDTEAVRKDLANYAFEINWFDRHVGLMVEELEKRNLKEDTLIIVTSDNGCPFPRVKGQMYDDDFRLPFIVKSCNANKNRRTRCLVSFVDIAPTILDYCQARIPEAMDGISLKSLIEDGKALNRTEVVMGRERHDLGREHDYGYPVRCLRTQRYLYCRNIKPDRWPAGNPETGFTNCDSSPTKEEILRLKEEGNDFFWNLAFGKRTEEELYDIKNDPRCMHNLATNVKNSELKKKLSKKLDEILISTGDPRASGGGDEFDTYPYVGKGHHSWKDYREGTFQKQTF